MKLITLNILIIMLCTWNHVYSQETWNYVNKSGTSFILDGMSFSEGQIETVPLKPLYEMFTSSTCGPCVAANEVLTEVLDANPDEYTLIKYQMDWPGNGDPYYTQEGGVRKSYYGVYFVPDLYINSEQLEPANDGEKYDQGMHPHPLAHQSGFKEIFNATRKDNIKY